MAKKTVTATRGNTYLLTSLGKKNLADISGQGALIRDILASKGPLTASEIVTRAGKNLKSKTPEKNIAFYLCIWKADGFVKFGPRPAKK